MEHARRTFIAGSLFLFLMAPVPILTTLTFLTSSFSLAVYVGITILLALWVKNKTIRYMGHFISFIALIVLLFMPIFRQGLQPLQMLAYLLSQHESQLMMIAAVVFICAVNLVFEYQHWKISFVIIFNFLILSQLLKQVNIFRELIVFVFASLLLAFLLEQKNLFKNKERVKLTSLTIFILMMSFASAFVLPQLFSSQKGILTQATNYVQQELSKTNFYQLFNPGKVKNTTGYGENDAELGGPLEKDFSPVFQATFNKGMPTENFYWRIEAKDYYTGRGWEAATEQFREMNVAEWSNETTSYLSKEENHITIQTQEETHYFVAPYGKNHFYASIRDKEETIIEQQNTEKVMPKQEWPTQEYTLVNRNPAYTIEQLKQVDFAKLEPAIQKAYTQLPDTVPQRVHQLAKTLTTGKQTTYEKVDAIEHYLKNSGAYSYSQQEAKQTPIGHDYVDYFLFDTKIGYCDNFASSMVVLNRTLGIPTRWVKGFTLGTLAESMEEKSYYQVTNNDAHSWVEVYFPTVGWVPFDPTTGFGITQPDSQNGQQQPNEEKSISKDSSPEALEHTPQQKKTMNNLFENNQFSLLLIAFLVIVGLLFYHFRINLRMKKLNRYLKKKQATFTYAFSQLLVICEAYQKKEAGETIRDYGKRLMRLEPQLSASLLFLLNRYEEIEFGQAKNIQIQSADRTTFETVLKVMKESDVLNE